MPLTELALKNSRITLAAIVLVALSGLSIYLAYPSAEDPTITIREASITAYYPGMSADRVEDLITQPIENAMREIAEIKDITSTSKTGETMVDVKIHDYVDDLDAVFQDIRNKAVDLEPQLPNGTSGPFVNDEVGLTAIATIALWADGFTLAEMRDVARDVRDRLYTLDGIKRVQLLGVQEERIYLETIPAEVAQLGVAPQSLIGSLIQQNVISPGGSINASGRTIIIEPSGNYESVDEIRETVFTIPNTNRVARLDEVFDIRRTYVDPPEKPSYFNDHESVILSVSTIEGTNNVEFGERLTTMVNGIQQELPIGYVLEYATFQPELIETAVQGAVSNVYQTLAIVLAVVMVFLGLRTGLIVGSFVPMTMLLGIIVMSLLEVELQRMSIAAMIIALGLLVDNGIVIAEDIRVRLERGVERIQAAIQSGRMLAIPLLTSSLTTIFAFLPMLLVEGEAGEYVRSLAQVVAILLLASWFLSMTMTPVICAWFMKVDRKDSSGTVETETSYDSAFYLTYRRLLERLLRMRGVFVAVLVVLLIGATQIMGSLRNEFFPLGDRNQFLVYLDYEAGTDVREVQTEVRLLTAWLSDKELNPEVTSNVAYIGYGGPRFFLALSPVDPDPHRAFVTVNTHEFDDVDPMIARVNAFLDANLPGARADAKKMWFGGSEPSQLKIRLIGPDEEILADRAERLMSAFKAVPGTVGIQQDWENKILKLVFNVDQVRARRAGVSSSDVANSLNTIFSGQELSQYREGDKSIPIVLRGEERIRFSMDGLGRTLIYGQQSGQFFAIDQIGEITAEWQYGRIQRRNQQRTLTVQARNPDVPSLDLLAEVAPVLETLDLPAGYRWEVGGEPEDQAEANEKLFGLVPISLSGIILLLIAQFNSFRKAGIILATIPLILIGGSIGLLIMNAAFGFMVILGFFSLAGIVINNGIVLIDRIEIEESKGRDSYDAVVQACLARLRPILMTTLTTVLGLIPLILFGGALFYGMASVIAYGLIVATVLTLGFVPALYTLLMRVKVPS